MKMIATEELLEDIQIDVTDEGEEIAQNIAVLLASPQGSIPLERGMGLPMNFRDQPNSVAQAMLESELASAIDEYEDRASLSAVSTTTGEGGNTRSKVEVNFNGG